MVYLLLAQDQLMLCKEYCSLKILKFVVNYANSIIAPNNNIISLFWSFQRPHKTFSEFKWGSDCFNGCYNIKTNISLTVN